MKTIDKSGFLELLKQTVSNQNIQEPVILITNNTKCIVDIIKDNYTKHYTLNGYPQDQNRSYIYQKPAECDIYHYTYTHLTEYGVLQYAIDIATKGHKPSFILLDNNTEINHFPSDIIDNFPAYEFLVKSSLSNFNSISLETNVAPNQEEYLKQCIKDSTGYERVYVYSQLISIYIDKCSSSSDLKLQEKLGDLLNFMLESVKVEEVKVSETINILLDIASKIKVLNKRNIDGYDARCVEKAKEISVVANVSDDVKNRISDMEKQYQNVDELIKEYPEFDKIVYSDKLRSQLIK